jgi:hypothetical protein
MIDVELDSLIKRSRSYLDSISADIDPQLTTLLHRYICVLVSSNIDKAMHLILTEYASMHGSGQLRQYVSKRYVRGTNYNTQRLVTALSLFDAQWGKEFEEQSNNFDLKEKIDSICAIRNSVAHGELANISRPSLNGYFEAHKKVIGLIKEIVLG